MMVVVVMVVTSTKIAVVVVMILCLSDHRRLLCVVGLERAERVRHRIEQLPVIRCRSKFAPWCGHRRCSGHGCERCRADEGGNTSVHRSSRKCSVTLKWESNRQSELEFPRQARAVFNCNPNLVEVILAPFQGPATRMKQTQHLGYSVVRLDDPTTLMGLAA